jgi:SAM-dependent methyltransferase
LAEGARTFRASGQAYDRFMGRYSTRLAPKLIEAAGVRPGQKALDVGCGPGALTAHLVQRLGAGNVAAIDPSESFVEVCRSRNEGVEVIVGEAEALPFDDDSFDVALAQLVFHFMTDPLAGAQELRRVVRPAGRVAGCVWDFHGGMRMLRCFWDAALEVDSEAPAETSLLGREGELPRLFHQAGLKDLRAAALHVEVAYEDFDDLWGSFLGSVGPAGAYCVSLAPPRREELRAAYFRRLESPEGPFTLDARAWYAVGVV